MKILNSGVTTPKGFKANGLWCGIKRSGKPDLALITSDVIAIGAASFTKNSIKAAPLLVTQKHIKNNKIQAFVVNSGNANCFTGEFGLKYAQETTAIFSKLLNIKKENVIVASTGIIGKPLPFEKIKGASSDLVKGLSIDGSHSAAKAILTTDLKTKEISVEFTIDKKKVKIGACAKGSGMIAPNMATMLAFITTDVAITPKMLKLALKNAVDLSFNCITIDGCMSTNDMAAIMANGLAGNKIINTNNKNFIEFSKALNYVCLDLAKKMLIDGEGATKFITIKILNATTEKQAKTIALAIANSVLVKTAAFGSNPNWGRVAAAVGSLGIKNIKEENLKIKFSSFDKKDIEIITDIGIGNKNATAYTTDLSYEYVRINAEYN